MYRFASCYLHISTACGPCARSRFKWNHVRVLYIDLAMLLQRDRNETMLIVPITCNNVMHQWKIYFYWKYLHATTFSQSKTFHSYSYCFRYQTLYVIVRSFYCRNVYNLNKCPNRLFINCISTYCIERNALDNVPTSQTSFDFFVVKIISFKCCRPSTFF